MLRLSRDWFYKHSLKLGTILVAWLVLALLISVSSYFMNLERQLEVSSFFSIVLFEIACLLPWPVFAPFLIKLARRYPLNSDLGIKKIFVHLTAALFIFTLHGLAQSFSVSVYYEEPFTWSYFGSDMLYFLDMRLMMYIGVLLGVYTFDYFMEERERAIEESEKFRQLNEARYQTLLNQIQPSFLLATLDSIKDTISEDRDRADVLIIDLSSILRILLNSIRKIEIDVSQDEKLWRNYIELLNKRFNTSVVSKFDIDEEVYRYQIPSIAMLIPFFEDVAKAEPSFLEGLSTVLYSINDGNEELKMSMIFHQVNIGRDVFNRVINLTPLLDIQERMRVQYDTDLQVVLLSENRELVISLNLAKENLAGGRNNWEQTIAEGEV